jgi:hypothetical protein
MEVPMVQNDQWFVTNLALSGGGSGLVAGLGVNAFLGSITFQHVLNSVPTWVTRSIAVSGMAAGLSTSIPSAPNSGIAQKILTFIANNVGLSSANAWSLWPTLGICFPNRYKASSLQSFDFFGDCALISVGLNAGPVGAADYILIFGLPTGFWSWKTTFLLQLTPLIGPHVASHCKGAALIISPPGAGLSGTAGAAGYGMTGRIV